MTDFLETVAREYLSRYSDIGDLCFVFPNKRAGTFFLRHLCRLTKGETLLAPEITTIADFAEEVSGRVCTNRIDLLFRLYKAYVALLAKNGVDVSKVDFDSFRSWGEVVLSDFNDVDMYCADAEALFQNVHDFKEIQSTFLTEDQLEILQEYFGYTASVADFRRFWEHMDYHASHDPANNAENRRETDVRRRFLQLWESLFPLYTALHKSLDDEGLAYPGMTYRLALERLREEGTEILDCQKVVFVGFNVLSTAEWNIFKLLKRTKIEIDGRTEPMADFVWDFTGPAMTSDDNGSMRFMRTNMRCFPMPEWLDLSASEVKEMPGEIRAIGAPSNVAQALIAGDLLTDLQSRLKPEEFADAKVAVILPDESLLFPMLYKLPESIPGINLTMGYPLRQTSMMSFVSLVRLLQMHKRTGADGVIGFYHEDVSLLIAHPFMHRIFGARRIAKAKKKFALDRKYVITPNEIAAHLGDEALRIFVLFDNNTGATQTIAYLQDVMHLIRMHIGNIPATDDGEGPDPVEKEKAVLDRAHIDVYLDALRRLNDSISKYGIDMNYNTVFLLADRLLGAETVRFEGEPLAGLQIAGLLETRCIDFDYLIIPSMNERIFPRRMRKKTFIPDSLRHAYGIPPARYEENIFAYYFYRMISRAREVTMIYDSRVSGLKSADPSRYILQLRHLYAKGALKEESRRFTLTTWATDQMTIPKTPEVMAQLEQFCVEGSKCNMSSSLLEHYLSCPMKFYYERVQGVRDDADPQEYIDPITTGNVVHAVMQKIYLPDPEMHKKLLLTPVTVTAERIKNLLDDKDRIEAMVRHEINSQYYKLEENRDRQLSGDTAITARVLTNQIIKILEHDLSLTPFDLFGCEISDTFSMHIDGMERPINMRFAIDRLDRINVNGTPVMRIVDYKTGKPHLKSEDIEEVFSGDYSAKHTLQLMLYANFYNIRYGENPSDPTRQEPIRLEIYNTNKINELAIPQIGGVKVLEHTEINNAFHPLMMEKIAEIFDPSVPFTQTPDLSRCSLCPFASICAR